MLLHHPLLTSGVHRFDDLASFGTPDRIDVFNALHPVLEQQGVQLVFAGHDHNYERFVPVGGVHEIVAGGGGVPLRTLGELDALSSQFWLKHHCVFVEIEGDRLRLEAIDEYGAVFDRMSLRRTVPPSAAYQARWHTPLIEAGGGTDGDGNLIGQRFDFIGDPVTVMAGRSSNLGEFHVNHDHEFLYLGLAKVMHRAGQDILLFLELPGETGLTGMTGVGDGIVDATGEGADGLDVLENLSFTNFAPQLAFVLGDEFGDGTFRSLVRSNQVLNAGQGGFWLRAGLPSVPGVRIQQFNRSHEQSCRVSGRHAPGRPCLRVVVADEARIVESCPPLVGSRHWTELCRRGVRCSPHEFRHLGFDAENRGRDQ